ncbi:MAG: hypothetical protein QNJ55_33675 [Xenococcus sp. MO_188.B8]|nr:hypothetical protein [Xenococcus sp. MO_188.B8]
MIYSDRIVLLERGKRARNYYKLSAIASVTIVVFCITSLMYNLRLRSPYYAGERLCL